MTCGNIKLDLIIKFPHSNLQIVQTCKMHHTCCFFHLSNLRIYIKKWIISPVHSYIFVSCRRHLNYCLSVTPSLFTFHVKTTGQNSMKLYVCCNKFLDNINLLSTNLYIMLNVPKPDFTCLRMIFFFSLDTNWFERGFSEVVNNFKAPSRSGWPYEKLKLKTKSSKCNISFKAHVLAYKRNFILKSRREII